MQSARPLFWLISGWHLGRLHEAIGTVEQLLQFVMDQGEPISLDTADLHQGVK